VPLLECTRIETDCLCNRGAHHELPGLRSGTETSHRIGCIAQDGEVVGSGLADDSNPSAAGMNADSRRDPPAEAPVGHEIRHELSARIQSVNWVIAPAKTLSPQGHHSITSEMVNNPMIPVNRAIHGLIEVIEDRPEVTCRQLLCERRRATDVRE